MEQASVFEKKICFFFVFFFYVRAAQAHPRATHESGSKKKKKTPHNSASAFDCSVLIATLPSPEEPMGEEVN